MGKINELERKILLKWYALIFAIFIGDVVGVFLDFTSDYLSYHKGYKEEIIKGAGQNHTLLTS